MNHGPVIFLAAFFALASSWVGFVLAPQLQVGQLQQTNTLGAASAYPLARPGLARQGREVYRANGCVACHSQQVGQAGTACDVVLVAAGTNQPAVVAALLKARPDWPEARAKELLASLPNKVLEGLSRERADAEAKALSASGATAQSWITPYGPDLARRWGKRRTVAEDYLYDYPVLLGSLRVGPDLANLALRQPDANWHLRHLYAPRSEVKESSMPPYRFLFERRRIEREKSTEALVLPKELAPPAGYEVVPRPEAKALVAYLLSLRADAPLFDAPLSAPGGPEARAATNAAVVPNQTPTNTAVK